MSSLTTLLVDSRNSVSLGDSLWNTTFWMEDFPPLGECVYVCNTVCVCVCVRVCRFIVLMCGAQPFWICHPLVCA